MGGGRVLSCLWHSSFLYPFFLLLNVTTKKKKKENISNSSYLSQWLTFPVLLPLEPGEGVHQKRVTACRNLRDFVRYWPAWTELICCRPSLPRALFSIWDLSLPAGFKNTLARLTYHPASKTFGGSQSPARGKRRTAGLIASSRWTGGLTVGQEGKHHRQTLKGKLTPSGKHRREAVVWLSVWESNERGRSAVRTPGLEYIFSPIVRPADRVGPTLPHSTAA